jgi:hypothetical protein
MGLDGSNLQELDRKRAVVQRCWKPTSTQAPDWLYCTCDRQESPELGSEAREVVRCGVTLVATLLPCAY